MTEGIQTKLTAAEHYELVEWLLRSDEMTELVDVLILAAEEAGIRQKTRVKRLRLLRRAIEVLGETVALVDEGKPQ